MKTALSLALLAASAAWADEAADRAAIVATVSALNNSPTPPNIFTADFPNAAELQGLRAEAQPSTQSPAAGGAVRTAVGTLVISREPMGEATWYPLLTAARWRFVTRSVTFTAADTAVVVAVYERPFTSQSTPVLFVLKQEGTDWRIASFRVLPEARTKAPL